MLTYALPIMRVACASCEWRQRALFYNECESCMRCFFFLYLHIFVLIVTHHNMFKKINRYVIVKAMTYFQWGKKQQW